MEWSQYCERLESWVTEQYKAFGNMRNTMQSMMFERDRIAQAHYMAQRKYETEMQKLQRRASPTISTLGASSSTQDNNLHRNQFHRYTIPHPWRRIAAEFIDSIFILCIKLLLISILKNESSFTDLYKYFGLNAFLYAPEYQTLRRAKVWANSEFRKNGLPLSRFEKFLHLLQNGIEDEMEVYDLDLMLLIDHLGRFLGALVEAFFISYCFFGRGPGGATIGKWLMNLQVVSCDEVIPLPDMVEVSPGTHLGFSRALVRSMLKGPSFLTVFSFFGMLFFQYHRCTYDIIAGTLVVQPVPTSVDRTEDNGRNQPAEHHR